MDSSIWGYNCVHNVYAQNGAPDWAMIVDVYTMKNDNFENNDNKRLVFKKLLQSNSYGFE